MTNQTPFRSDNTEGYSADQLAALNAEYQRQAAGIDPDSDEGKATQERILREHDSGR